MFCAIDDALCQHVYLSQMVLMQDKAQCILCFPKRNCTFAFNVRFEVVVEAIILMQRQQRVVSKGLEKKVAFFINTEGAEYSVDTLRATKKAHVEIS